MGKTLDISMESIANILFEKTIYNPKTEKIKACMDDQKISWNKPKVVTTLMFSLIKWYILV